MTDAPIRTVAVIGAGVTAWSAAAALKRRIPSLDVELISTSRAPDTLANRVISTTPSIHGFHHDIGLSDADTITGAASGLRVGSLFERWSEGQPSYVHAYGAYGIPIGSVAFHHLWLREHRTASLPPFDHFSPAAELARSGAPLNASSRPTEFGLQLTLERYSVLMRDYALHMGVRTREAAISQVTLRSADGFIDTLVCDNEDRISADLFIDCTGPAALLHSHLDAHFIDWCQWLPCDRVILGDGAPDAALVSMDRVTALPFGWRWGASSPLKSSYGLSYSSTHAREEEIERELGGRAAEVIALRQGRKPQFWVRNCVAIGDCAVTIEPLEWTNLHLAHSQIDRLIAMMPGRDCAAVELAEFNRQCACEADRVRDFVALHYVCSRRPEPFWQDAAAATPPQSLAHTLALFTERGRLPFYEEETFTRDSWLAVLLGQGVEPRRINPLAEAVSSAEAGRAFAAMRRSLASFTLPAATFNDLNPRGIR